MQNTTRNKAILGIVLLVCAFASLNVGIALAMRHQEAAIAPTLAQDAQLPPQATWGSFRRLLDRYNDLETFCDLKVDRAAIKLAGQAVTASINKANGPSSPQLVPEDLVTLSDDQELPAECGVIWQLLEKRLRESSKLASAPTMTPPTTLPSPDAGEFFPTLPALPEIR